MEEEEAEYHYSKINDHMETMKLKIGRPVGFRVAMLDYLLNINPKMDCPKFMEISSYNTMLSLTFLDGLTGLFNRRYFDNHFLKELNRSKRYGQTFSLVLLDIDDFKLVNDNHGHQTGDCILKQFSQMLKNHLRSEDIAARYGGEEFIVLLPQTDIKGSINFSERFLCEVRSTLFAKGLTITFSGGVSCYPIHGFTKNELIETADKAMYSSKTKGKNQISVIDEERRENRRYPLQTFLYFDTPIQQRCEAIVQNISLTGLAGVTQKQIVPGQIITLHLSSEEEPDNQYEIDAQIVWIHKIQHSPPLKFGAKYTAADQKTVYRQILPILPAESSEESDEQPYLF